GALDNDRLNKENSEQNKDNDDQEYVAHQAQTFGPKALPGLAFEMRHLDITVIGGRDETELKLVFALKIEHNQAL
ncbi:MAG: hypothetical protein WBO68_15355, partial [Pyrinomonadaceae bacterium]